MSEPKRCAVCGATYLLDEHHTVPRSLGGHDSELVTLCRHCHELVHRVARKILSGRAAEASQMVRAATEARPGFDLARFNHLVSLIVQHAHQREGRVPPDNPQEVRLKLPRALRAALKRAAWDAGLSVEKFIVRCVVKELRRLGWRV